MMETGRSGAVTPRSPSSKPEYRYGVESLNQIKLMIKTTLPWLGHGWGMA